MTRRLASLLLGGVLLVLGSPALAAGSVVPGPDGAEITYVEPGTEQVRVLVSLPSGAAPDLDGVRLTVGGEELATTARAAADSGAITRTTVLAVDTSNSMRGERFAQAKAAAAAFVDAAPADLRIGVVSFAGEVVVEQAPTRDRASVLSVLEGLSLTRQTRLHEGVLSALEATGGEGLRTVLVLSDGRDTSAVPAEEVVAAIEESGVVVDVVALEQSGAALEALADLASAGGGDVIEAGTPDALTALFTAASRELATQLEVTGTLAQGAPREGEVGVVVPTAAGDLADTVFARVALAADSPAPTAGGVLDAPRGGGTVPFPVVVGAVVALAVALSFVAWTALAGAADRRSAPPSVEDRISAYGSEGHGPTGGGGGTQVQLSPTSVIAHAKDAAAQALRRNRSLEARIADRLDGAALGLKPAEWVLLHAGVVVGSAFLGFLLGSGSVVLGVLLALVGVVGPWVYLGLRRSRRVKAFGSGLADTLQLMAGSLQAGLSLTQSVDTIVKEGVEPIAGEFRRVLVETRLGVELEDALDDVARRMDSQDFSWVVMAIRIQREVGGNLAELLLTVAATLREREYLRRHVSALSAEGRLSAWVLGGLPPLFLVYLVVARRDYVMPLFTDPRGWIMLAFAALLLGVGAFWMSKMAKVDI